MKIKISKDSIKAAANYIIKLKQRKQMEANELKAFTIKATITEIRNLAQGLDMLHSKCMENMAAIHPLDGKAPEFKKYFREKQQELKTQIIEINNLLNNG